MLEKSISHKNEQSTNTWNYMDLSCFSSNENGPIGTYIWMFGVQLEDYLEGYFLEGIALLEELGVGVCFKHTRQAQSDSPSASYLMAKM